MFWCSHFTEVVLWWVIFRCLIIKKWLKQSPSPFHLKWGQRRGIGDKVGWMWVVNSEGSMAYISKKVSAFTFWCSNIKIFPEWKMTLSNNWCQDVLLLPAVALKCKELGGHHSPLYKEGAEQSDNSWLFFWDCRANCHPEILRGRWL